MIPPVHHRRPRTTFYYGSPFYNDPFYLDRVVPVKVAPPVRNNTVNTNTLLLLGMTAVAFYFMGKSS